MKAFEVGGTTLSLALFTDVTNTNDLLMGSAGRTGGKGTLEPEIALLNALLLSSILLQSIPDVFPVLAASHKTPISKSREAITRTLHSELVYNYLGSKHISESLKRWYI